ARRLFPELIHGRRIAFPGYGQIEIRPKSGEVGEELTQGDRLFAPSNELRQIAPDSIAEADLSSFSQKHDRGRGCHYLGERSHIENRVRRHRFPVWLQCPVAERLEITDLSSPRYQNHGAR